MDTIIWKKYEKYSDLEDIISHVLFVLDEYNISIRDYNKSNRKYINMLLDIVQIGDVNTDLLDVGIILCILEDDIRIKVFLELYLQKVGITDLFIKVFARIYDYFVKDLYMAKNKGNNQASELNEQEKNEIRQDTDGSKLLNDIYNFKAKVNKNSFKDNADKNKEKSSLLERINKSTYTNDMKNRLKTVVNNYSNNQENTNKTQPKSSVEKINEGLSNIYDNFDFMLNVCRWAFYDDEEVPDFMSYHPFKNKNKNKQQNQGQKQDQKQDQKQTKK